MPTLRHQREERVASVKRMVLAVSAGYLANALLVAISEHFLTRLFTEHNGSLPRSYFVCDLITQCVYTIAAGYLCGVVARSWQRALYSLISLAILVGTFSLATSWKAEPHWYGIALLMVYPPCAWAGFAAAGSGNSLT